MNTERNEIMQIGFDSEKYLEEQSRYIMERVDQYDKLYIEFGGKLMGDYHAMRVLPGFDPDGKIKLLHRLRHQAEIIICIYAGDIENKKIRSDFGITYDQDVLRMIDDLVRWELLVNSVVITRYNGQSGAQQLKAKLEARGIKVYTHGHTQGYPMDVDTIVSPEGYGKNTYIETTRPLVVVTAPGPNSGKLGTCLSQFYHEVQLGRKTGYAKFETFPVWNLPLHHPVNIAYEAATADLEDVNMIDTFHLEKYGQRTVNYNRDIEAFPLLRRILTKINKGAEVPYYSPTDMGVNRVGFAITDDDIVSKAANQEIIRRYFASQSDYKKGIASIQTAQRSKLIMDESNLSPNDRPVVQASLVKAQAENLPVVAIQLEDGQIITGKASSVMTASAACILNAIKSLASIGDDLHLLTPMILSAIDQLNSDFLMQNNHILNTNEVLIALSISAVTNPTADLALNQLSKLRHLQAHSTVIPAKSDDQAYRALGIMMTSEPEFASTNLYYE